MTQHTPHNLGHNCRPSQPATPRMGMLPTPMDILTTFSSPNTLLISFMCPGPVRRWVIAAAMSPLIVAYLATNSLNFIIVVPKPPTPQQPKPPKTPCRQAHLRERQASIYICSTGPGVRYYSKTPTHEKNG